MKTTLVTLAAATALVATASTAEAKQGVSLGIDVGPNFVVEDLDPGADSAGIGINGRIGYQFDGGVIRLTPELKVGFESPGTPDAFRIMGGVRMSLLKGFQPVVFAHLGGLTGDVIEGFTWDVGGGLDFAAGPLTIGANVSYNRAEEQSFSFANLTEQSPGAYEWIQIAASVGLVF